MKKLLFAIAVLCTACGVWAERTGPWTKEQAWKRYDRQPWIRGCNYMPASCANRADQWQALGANPTFQIIGKLEKFSDGNCGLSASFGNIAA